MASSNRSTTKLRINTPPRSAVDLSHEKKLSFQMGQLVPIYWDEVVPSDKFRVRTELLVRLAPMLAPVMHMINAFVHFFYVPYRILWENAEEFFTGGEDGLSSNAVPYWRYQNSNKTYFDKGRLMDYLGIPPTAATITQTVDLLAFLPSAYLKIYDEYYRNPNIQSERWFPLSNGDNSTSLESAFVGNCLTRNLEPDYFISALPVAQRGNAIELDLDVVGLGASGGNINLVKSSGAAPTAGATSVTAASAFQDSAPANLRFKENVSLGAEATLEITELRRAVRLQEFLELANLAGGKYEDQMEIFFGQKPADARLQKPEYLGGGRQAVQISEITATAETLIPSTDALSKPIGEMSGRGISMGSHFAFERQFPEHGVVMGILSVMPRTAYFEGIDRHWRKTDRTEFLWPKFAQLGEQEILQSEIYWDPVGTDKDDTFGYQSRYAEYKYKKSSVHGDFIDDFDYWHLARQLGSAPTLDNTFIVCENTDYDRIFAVTTGTVDKLYAQVYHSVQAVRPLPSVNVPVL